VERPSPCGFKTIEIQYSPPDYFLMRIILSDRAQQQPTTTNAKLK
jgi:hypothetical protein